MTFCQYTYLNELIMRVIFNQKMMNDHDLRKKKNNNNKSSPYLMIHNCGLKKKRTHISMDKEDILVIWFKYDSRN